LGLVGKEGREKAKRDCVIIGRSKERKPKSSSQHPVKKEGGGTKKPVTCNHKTSVFLKETSHCEKAKRKFDRGSGKRGGNKTLGKNRGKGAPWVNV